MEGKQLGGRYQLEARIGGGGMAIVYKARDLILNRQVAVKVLRPHFGTDEDFVNRFRREAQAVASLSHPNVVSVYDVGQDDDTHYMVMECVEGSTLKDLINAQGALPIEEAVRIAVQICDALDHAHQNKIIHRDIKPHNILIGKNGRVKVTDFGIARAVTSATITHTNSVLGSVHYFSPEQARGGLTAEKSDIYSLGIVLYEMLTGELPFSGDSPISVALKHLQEPLPEPRTLNPDIPQSLENVVLKALVKDPLLRYGSAREMLTDLETCLSPERRNEPKIEFPVDEEQTRVLPVITPEMLEQANQERETLQRGRFAEEAEEEVPKRNKWWVKAIAWAGAAGLFVVLALVGFNLLTNILDVPEITVPYVEGMQVDSAVAKIEESKLVPHVVERPDNSVEKGLVISQDPGPTMRLKENATVTLYVSTGKQMVSMPNLVSLSRRVAEETLRLKGFNEANITFKEQEDENIPPDQVISQTPEADKQVVPGEEKVTVVISKEKKYVPMPDVRGYSLEQAKVALFNAGLRVAEDKITYEPTYLTDKTDVVISTRPWEPEMRVPAGEAIPLQLSNGKYPADAKPVTENIFIDLPPGEAVRIRITVTDARMNDQVVVDEMISESREYPIDLVLSPQKNGTINVFRNDEQAPFQSFTYEYSNQP